jgi:hypothetical protein
LRALCLLDLRSTPSDESGGAFFMEVRYPFASSLFASPFEET